MNKVLFKNFSFLFIKEIDNYFGFLKLCQNQLIFNLETQFYMKIFKIQYNFEY